jgi:excisionase family DNA binding protein
VSAPALERYVTAGELAELMGVSERTIRRMVAAGMPSETWGMGRTRRFLPSEAVAWAQSRSTIATVNPPRTARQRQHGA